MNARHGLSAVRQLVRDTGRQARASGISWIMLAITALCVVLCLSVSVAGDVRLHDEDELVTFRPPPHPRVVAPSIVLVLGSSGTLDTLTRMVQSQPVWFSLETNPEVARREGIETVSGRMTLAFGLISFPVVRERKDAVHFLELLLGGGIAGTFGLLLALVWTAGFMPTFLEPSAAAVLLAKPAARWQLLLGKYCGVLAFLGFHTVLFVVLTWLALGLRTGVWDATYLWSIPLVMLQFAIFYSFSVLLAVVFRSTAACVIGSVLFWLLAWGINYGSVLALAAPESQSLPPFTHALAEAAYWISPKPMDAGLILFNALEAHEHFQMPQAFQLLESWRAFSPQLSILSCLAITAVLLALSAYELKATDY